MTAAACGTAASETLAAAVAAHQDGRLDVAEAGYRRILAAEPDHADALHLLGVICHQRGDDTAAVEWIGRAIGRCDTVYKYHFNLAAALQGLGRHGEALACYRQAAALAPELPAVALALAQLLLSLGQPEEAGQQFRRTLELAPEEPGAAAGLGAALHALGQLSEAEEYYRQSLDHRPDHAATLVNLGSVLHSLGRLDAAADCHRRAVTLEPGLTLAHVNLGAVLQAQGRTLEAVRSYRQALVLSPSDATVHFNLGTAVHAVGWLDEAIRCYRDALRLWPSYAEAYNNMGQVLEAQNKLTEAARAFRLACALRPERTGFHYNLACCLYLLYRQKPESARAHAAEWLADHPGQPIARHMADAFAAATRPPPQPAAGYVQSLFDGFAGSFDHELLSIGYCGPELMATSFARMVPVPRGDLEVLDAGCGTGLCGPVLRPWARRLTGVDLSPRMLELASRRGLYDQLVEADLVAYLAGQPAGRFHLIAAADVFCYFGDLEALVSGLARVLQPGGALAFTAEQAPDSVEPFRLAAHGRYLHGETALRDLLTAQGLSLAALSTANLRNEDGQPSPNLVVLAVRS